MATLKNTTINDTGFIQMPVGTTAQRPASPVTGMTRFNTTENAKEYYNNSAWKLDISPDGTSATKAAVNATQLLSYQSTSGYYWIKPPNAPSAYYVYCDLTNRSGGWMLMMKIGAINTTHSRTNAANLTTVNTYSTCNPLITSRWATTDINYFLQQPGIKLMWIEATNRNNVATTNNSGRDWFLRPGTQSSPVWPTNLECTEYNTLISSATTSWLWQGYADQNNALDNTSMYQGNYSGTGHWAPTVYPTSQSFFDGGSGGLRASTFPSGTGGDYVTSGNAAVGGYLWLKVY